MAEKYDIIIIGAGPAGLTAGIYCGRFKQKTLMLDAALGGSAKEAHKVENYPGFESISGIDLIDKVKEHAIKSGVEIKNDNVSVIKKEETGFKITTANANEYISEYVIIATGNKRKKLGIPGEDEFLGKGVSYCATCDAPFFKGKDVAVVGGGNAAVMAATLLKEHANKIYMIYRGDALRAEPVWVERVENDPKIKIFFNTKIKEAKGSNILSSLILDNGKTLEASGLFIEIGGLPSVDIARSLDVKLNKNNKIIVTPDQKTNVENVFAAGDITTASAEFQQIVTAMSEGSIAAWSIMKSKKRQTEYE